MKIILKNTKNLPDFLIAGEEDPVGNYGKAVKMFMKFTNKQGLRIFR